MTSADTAGGQTGPAAASRPRHGRRARHVLGASSRHRVVFAGPVGVGKTTAVRSLTDVAAVDTDVPITPTTADRPQGTKTTTTVGIDYGVWKPTDELSVSLVGTPGQERFGATRASLLVPHSRIVLWVFGDDPDLTGQVRTWLETLGAPALYRRLAIAVTRTADDGAGARAELLPLLGQMGADSTPVLAVDPRDRASVMRIVSAALDRPEEHR